MEYQPFFGAKMSVNNVNKNNAKTIHGPVGIFPLKMEKKTPKTPEKTPNKAAKNIIIGNLSVQYLAEAAGAINKADIKTTPTVCIPIATVKTVKVESKNSTSLTFKPMDLAKSGLKHTN